MVLDEEVLRKAFDRVVGEVHPDVGGERDEFAGMRAAYDTLRQPGRRLRHWLELGGVGWEAGGSVPEVLLTMFGEIGGLIQRVDGMAGRSAAAQSVLVRSMLEREAMGLAEEVESRMAAVRTMRDGLVDQFEAFEQVGPVGCGNEAEEVARTLMFLEKWEGQLRERWAGLAM